ncbi:hypothetical protein HDA40_000687 [Hamadaea flava]|nr:hypothetical protein [Hamadaea flava]
MPRVLAFDRPPAAYALSADLPEPTRNRWSSWVR